MTSFHTRRKNKPICENPEVRGGGLANAGCEGGASWSVFLLRQCGTAGWAGRPGPPWDPAPASAGPQAGPPESRAGRHLEEGGSGDTLQPRGQAEKGHCARSQAAYPPPSPSQASQRPGAVEGSPLEASVSPTVQPGVPMARDALSGGEGVMTLPTGAEEPRGLSACPRWAPAEPALVPFLNINEQAQECPPHSWLRAGAAGRRGGRGGNGPPAFPDPPASALGRRGTEDTPEAAVMCVPCALTFLRLPAPQSSALSFP